MTELGRFFCPGCGKRTTVIATGMDLGDYQFLVCENCEKPLVIEVDVSARLLSIDSVASMTIREIKEAVSRLNIFLKELAENAEPCTEDAVIGHMDAKATVDRLDDFAERLRELCRIPGVKTQDKT